MEIEQWMGTSCHLCCQILDAEDLWDTRAKPLTLPVQDTESVNPSNKQDLPPKGPVGRFFMFNEELAKPGGTTPNPHIITSSVPSYSVYTSAEQDLGMHYRPVVTEYARNQYGGLMNIPKYGIFSEETPQGKNEVQYNQWIFEVEDFQKTYGEALVRKAIIWSLKGKVSQTICYLGHNNAVSAMLNKLNTI